MELHQDPGGDVTAQVGLEVSGALKDVAEARDPVKIKIFFTYSVHIKLALPQAEQLGIYFQRKPVKGCTTEKN